MVFAPGRELVAPRVASLLQAAAGGPLPLGLGREPAPRPLGVGDRLEPGHVHDRMVAQPVEVAVGPVGVTPVGSLDRPPPLGADHTPGGREVVGQETAEDERPALALGEGHRAGGVGEGGEVVVRHEPGGDGVGIDVHLADRTFAIRREPRVAGPHEERAGGQLDHVRLRAPGPTPRA